MLGRERWEEVHRLAAAGTSIGTLNVLDEGNREA